MPVLSKALRCGLLAAGVGALLAAAGCSTTDTFEQPAPVPEVSGGVEFDEVWDMSVGDGHDGSLLYLSPLNAGDTLYAASADGDVVAVKTDNGSLVWERELDDRIFAGVGGDAGHLYLVNRKAELIALSRDDGKELWRTALPTEVLAAPQSNGSLVVVQTTDGRVLSFDTAKGERQWQYESTNPALSLRAAAAPLVGGDVVIASFANGKLIALAADSGQPIWQYDVGEPSGRTELERLVDITGQPLVLDRALMVVGYQGKLALIDIQTGREVWSTKASSLYSPSVADGNIFLSLANGDLVSLQGSDRQELWRQDKLAWRQLTQPVVVGDHLVVGDFEGYLYAVSLKDGSLQGETEFDDEGIRVPVQPLGDGKLLVYGNGGRLAVLKLQPSE